MTQAHRLRLGLQPARLKPEFVEEFFSKHSGVAQARDVFSLVLEETTRRKIEIPDTEIVLRACVALKLQSRGVCFRKHMLEARIEIHSS